MKYTSLDKFSQNSLELNRLKREEKDLKKCFAHPSYFTHHMLGITPYRYQHLVLKNFQDNYRYSRKRVMICKSRQIGISITLACLAIWYAFCNKAKSGPYKDTKIVVISRSEDQAKKFMREVQKLIWNSKENLAEYILKDRKASLSKKELHFKNGWIKCFAPTDACRGETADLLIVDEAAFVDEDIFKDAMEPTVTAVDGKIILSSTPNGKKGFFFELFDPDDLYKGHEYKRYWFYWKQCENEQQRKIIKQKFKHAKETGNVMSFDQEYNALFTVDEQAFFEDKDVEKGLDKNLITMYEYKGPCSLGIDYGFTTSATCLTVVTKVKEQIKILWQFAQVNLDENLLMGEWEHSIPNLARRYHLNHIVVDDCPMGGRTNKQLENEGYPIIRFNFRSDEFKGTKNRGYYLLKAALRSDRLKYPELRKLMAEMKCLQEVKMEGGKYMKIKAPKNYSDDRCDSLMIACYPFLTDDESFSSAIVEYDKILKKVKPYDARHDYQWDELNNKDYDFMFKKGKGRPRRENGSE